MDYLYSNCADATVALFGINLIHLDCISAGKANSMLLPAGTGTVL